MFLYYTRGLVRWDGGVHCGDMGAMKAEGQARLEPPKIVAMHIRAIACGSGIRGVRGGGQFTSTQTAMDSVGSRVMDVSTVAGVRERRRVSSRFAACVLLCSLVAALRRTEKPLLSTCCDAAALLCLAPLPPANERASARRRC